MKIKNLHIDGFGTLKDRDFTFGDGIHLICGKNESGKTTLHTGINALLFGLDKAKDSESGLVPFDKYRPWHPDSPYGGKICWEYADELHCLQRDFLAEELSAGSEAEAEQETQVMVEAPEAAEMNASYEEMPEMPEPAEESAALPAGLEATTFRNTLSFRQAKAATEDSLAGHLRAGIINLHTSGAESLSVRRALVDLQNRHETLVAQLSDNAEQERQLLQEQLNDVNRRLDDLTMTDFAQLRKDKQLTESRLDALTAAHGRLCTDIERKETILRDNAVSNRALVDENREKTKQIRDELKVFHARYGEKTAEQKLPILLAINGLMLLLALGCFWFSALRLLSGKYFQGGFALLLVLIYAVLVTKNDRKKKAILLYRENLATLEELLTHYKAHDKKPTIKNAEGLIAWLSNSDTLIEHVDMLYEKRERQTVALTALRDRQDLLDRQIADGIQINETARLCEEELEDLTARLEAADKAIENNDRLREEIAAVELAFSTIQRLSAELFNSFGYHLSYMASQLLGTITGGAYERIIISDELRLMPVRRDGRKVPLQALSHGTMEQVYLAFRLSCIKFLWPDEDMPLFFDDSFSMYDDERLATLLSWLHENYKGQIFIFSCNSREERLLNESGIPYQRIQL